MDFFMVEAIARKRLEQRVVDKKADSVLFRVDRQSAVVLTNDECKAIGQDFRAAIRPSARVLRWSIILQIPVGIWLLSEIVRTPWLKRMWDASEGTAQDIEWLVISTALPVAGLIYHGLSVRREVCAVVASVADRPRISLAGRPKRRGLHVIEIVALVLFGPGALIDVYSSIFPHAFDHTPWMGRELGWQSMLGLLCFAAVLGRQAWMWATSPNPSPEVEPLPIPAMPQRRRALVAETADPA
jgi:hypothetical protein